MHRVEREVGRPLPAISGSVPAGGDFRGHPPDRVGPGQTSPRAVDVFFQIGRSVVLAMVGDPANGPALRGAAAEGGQDVFQPSGSNGEAAVRQQSVIGQADADAASQPHEKEANNSACQVK